MTATRLIKFAELADWYALGWRPVSFSGDWIEVERRFPGKEPVSRRRRGWYRPRDPIFLPASPAGNAAPVLRASQHAERLPSSDAAGAGAATYSPGPHEIETEVMPHTSRPEVLSRSRRDNATPPSYEVGAS